MVWDISRTQESMCCSNILPKSHPTEMTTKRPGNDLRHRPVSAILQRLPPCGGSLATVLLFRIMLDLCCDMFVSFGSDFLIFVAYFVDDLFAIQTCIFW